MKLNLENSQQISIFLRFLSEEDEEALRLELKEAFRIYDKVLSPEVFCLAARWRHLLTPSGGGTEHQVIWGDSRIYIPFTF